MQFTLALAAAIFASAISAAPAMQSRDTVYPLIKVSVMNDQTGRFATVEIPGDGHAHALPDLFRDSPIDQDGAIMATSAQLISYTPLTHCFFQNVNDIINMYGKGQNYVDLDGQAGVAAPRNMNAFNLQCNA
ncbi:hypothetical protein BU26DRAFT_518004 [Trematosphaeria pertusa]|uniref:Uncharacterized protein n=1 Tax=Trematosphaeria pertusa TaxID=390896 RepID=A0A6A6INC0_9PLEO|nr:uncharacterized protein BU26DRAFT_518004 [Trematosphaeria pertusa]KAF2251312.1 hypothetical protein BU26DRAFT_518004 [Trematosphaeria pertusa]